MDVDFIFRIAGIGVIVTVIAQLLSRAGRDDIAMLATLSGLVVVLLMVVNMISDFFTSIRSLFSLGGGGRGMILKVTALCVAVAMICSAIRLQRPEMATALSLATGLMVLTLLYSEFSSAGSWLEMFRSLMASDGDLSAAILKGAGIAVVAELGGQLCADAGETALAGRVALASRVAMLGLCAPMLAELSGLLRAALP